MANEVFTFRPKFTQFISGSFNKAFTLRVRYANWNSGTSYPSTDSSVWTDAPDPQKGMYMWIETAFIWFDASPTIYYTVTYIGEDGFRVTDDDNGNVTFHLEDYETANGVSY